MATHPKKRITDGVTLDKTILAIAAAVSTMCIGLITWVYTTDRTEFKQDIKSIAHNVAEIKSQQIVSYSHQENADARIEKNEHQLENLHKEFNEFYRKQRGYWGEND